MKNVRGIAGIIIGCAVVSGGASYAYLNNTTTQSNSNNVRLLSTSNKTNSGAPNTNAKENSVVTTKTNNVVTAAKASTTQASNSAVNQAMKTDVTNGTSNAAVTQALKTGQINLENNVANEFFLENNSYLGQQHYTNNIKINYNKSTNTITEYNLNTPNKVYTLKLVNSITQMGIQLNKYDNGQLVGRYNLIYGQGKWAGTYTELAPTANVVSNVVIQAN